MVNGPVVAAAGITAVTCVADTYVVVAATPLNLTIGVPLSKLVPFTVTTFVQDPELGVNEVKVGIGPLNVVY